MSIQSLMTPAMFIVKADVLPISRNTAYGVHAHRAHQQSSAAASTS